MKAGDKAKALKAFITLSEKQFAERHDLTRALACVNQAVTLATQLNDVKSLIEANKNGGIICERAGHVQQAIEYFEHELTHTHEAKEWETEVCICMCVRVSISSSLLFLAAACVCVCVFPRDSARRRVALCVRTRAVSNQLELIWVFEAKE